MKTRFYPRRGMIFTQHPKYANVKVAMFIANSENQMADVCLMEIAPFTEVPIHTHEGRADSVFVVGGRGESYVNGSWQPIEAGDYLFIPVNGEHGTRNTGAEPLRLFMHQSPQPAPA